MQLSNEILSVLAALLVDRTRVHPDIDRGASVRASLAVVEIARGYECIRGKLTKDELKDAAMLALPSRIKVRPESGKTPEYVVLEIVQELLFETRSLEYGDPFKKEKPPRSESATAEFTKGLMEFQEQQLTGKTRLKNLHAEFARRHRQGQAVDPDNLDYTVLEKRMHDLESEGIVAFDEIGDGYTLQAAAIMFLLKNIRAKDLSKSSKHGKKETAVEKSTIRKYIRGDRYRMVSLRHTLRRIIRKGKHINEISVYDIRCFEKVSTAGRDIAVCIDVSESMKEGSKLCYAKLAAAGVAKTAASNRDCVCIVSFSNGAAAECPLSSNVYRISQALLAIKTGKYTNAADAVKTARELLQKGNASNKKQIIMISDGQPNIASRGENYFSTGADDMENFTLGLGGGGNQHFHYETGKEMKDMCRYIDASAAVYREVKKSRRKDIEISFLYVGGEEEFGKNFAKKVARLGNGTFYHVKDTSELPTKALMLLCQEL